MSKLRQPFVQTRRDAWVEIDLGKIEENILALLNLCKKGVKLLAVVKADAYGHGSTMVVPTLIASGVYMLGVASVDEGIEIRNSGCNAPILVLGAAPVWAFQSAIENDITLSFFTKEHLAVASKVASQLGKQAKTYIKIDTGMHRIGLNYIEAPDFIASALDMEGIKVEGIFSHLACAENEEITKQQVEKFKIVYEKFPYLPAHLLNTAGLMSYPDVQFSMVRAGIGIYGLMPDLPESASNIPNLKPVMSLKGRIVYLKELGENEGISYSYSYKTSKKARIATVPIGYADGVPRILSNKIYGLINGKKVKQVGNITMDQMMFDVSDAGEINVGDVITLIGEDNENIIRIDEWAKLLNTINYELTCRLKVRLPRVYTR